VTLVGQDVSQVSCITTSQSQLHLLIKVMIVVHEENVVLFDFVPDSQEGADCSCKQSSARSDEHGAWSSVNSEEKVSQRSQDSRKNEFSIASIPVWLDIMLF